MRKVYKRLAISVAALIFIVCLVAGVAVWLVFTPQKLTPIVRKEASKYLTCKSQIGDVELTFFSTFPRFGIKVNGISLINHFPGASSDTLVQAQKLVGIVDLGAWWNRKELIINEVQLVNGNVSAYVDSLKRANFDVVKADTTTKKESTGMPFGLIDLENVSFENVSVSYIDKSMKLNAGIRNLTAEVSGKVFKDTVDAKVKIDKGTTSLTFGGEKYLSNAEVKTNSQLRFVIPTQQISIDNSEISVNNLSLALKGTLENNAKEAKMVINLDYKTDWLSISEILSLVPNAFQAPLKGIEADGKIQTEGKIKGIYSAKSMPLMDVKLKLEDGTLKYKALPFPLSKINGDIAFYSDLKNDAISFLQINSFSANTPRSSVKTKGKVTNLLSDIHCDLNSEGDFDLSEFEPMIPAKLKTRLKGRSSARVHSYFTLSQIQKMQLDKVKLSGSLKLSDFKADYDTISVQTDRSNIEFALPNPSASSKTRRFISGKLKTDNLQMNTTRGAKATLGEGWLSFETSDFRDSTHVPNVSCNFELSSLSAKMDTINLAVEKPSGHFDMVSRKGKPLLPEMNVTFRSGILNAIAGTARCKMNSADLKVAYQSDKTQPRMSVKYIGENLNVAMGADSARLQKVDLDASLLNDMMQKDKFRQWQGNGFVKVEKGNIAASMLKYPLQIPALQMSFTPEVFNIKESRLIIDKSDFSLSGKLSNVLSYFKSDSLLRGNFNFVSDKTDIIQLMQLTNGIGDKEADKKVKNSHKESSGPYMVPKGIDVLLNVNVASANYGTGNATDIKGALRVKDGILLMDDLNFITPAAKMKLTTVYQSKRKNHLYLGLDFQMMNVEIEELLKIVPDVDTLLPMLRSFSGKGDFHLAAETYLDSLYNPKMSTVGASATIKGKDLVLMDGQTFSEIAKTLRFSKKTHNKVDSLSAEFTVLKNEIDIFPFLIVMDKYKAVVAGQHNIDMTFNYHISVVDSPLPFKLGINIIGSKDKLKYSLAKCKYAEFYRPVARGVVKDKQLQLRQIIRDALMQKQPSIPNL